MTAETRSSSAAAEVGGERLEGVVVLLGGPLGGDPGLLERVEHDAAQQRGAVGEAAVERRDPDPGPMGDLVQGDAGALLGDQVAGRGEQLLEVAPGVGAHGHAAHPTEPEEISPYPLTAATLACAE